MMTLTEWRNHLVLRTSQLLAFSRVFIHHCVQDHITVSAGHLAYVSLLSLVPFIMVFFTILSAFPAFAEVRGELEAMILGNLLPQASDQLQQYLSRFVGNASGMGAVGILSLVVVALLLISNIDKTLNRIWQIKSDRPAIYTLAVYWMVLTLGPLLIGSSVLVSSYLVSLASFAHEYTPGLTTVLLKTVPFLTSITAFFLVYMLVPNKRIRARYAICGAFIGALLFELSKKAFAFYITSFPSYQLIYGALATIPILFLWVYLSWIVVLVGAEVTHVLEVFNAIEQDTQQDGEATPS